jgi:hypothetical protein
LKEKEKILFELLKQKVAQTFLRDNSALSPDISQWKGDDIVRFQEDLLQKVKGRVSEKWFYNYFRNDIQKLPRIDMLNLLSAYAGYENWANFKKINTEKPDIINKKPLKKYIVSIVLLIGLIVIISIAFLPAHQNMIRFCIVNENGQAIKDVRVTWLLSNQSEKVLNLQNNCIKLNTDKPELRLRIEAPYYKDKIIYRKIDTDNYKEKIILQTDLNALLLKHYSNSDSDNWQKRRNHLQKIISDSALIYQQWLDGDKGIELYDKDEFIGQLCIPTGWVKNMEILEIAYKNNQIIKLRFTVKKQK